MHCLLPWPCWTVHPQAPEFLRNYHPDFGKKTAFDASKNQMKSLLKRRRKQRKTEENAYFSLLLITGRIYTFRFPRISLFFLHQYQLFFKGLNSFCALFFLFLKLLYLLLKLLVCSLDPAELIFKFCILFT